MDAIWLLIFVRYIRYWFWEWGIGNGELGMIFVGAGLGSPLTLNTIFLRQNPPYR